MDHPPRPGVCPKKGARDRLIRLLASHPAWALGFEDETRWSRTAPPALHAWAPEDRPLRLIEQTVPKEDPDPKALAAYGLLVRAADAAIATLRAFGQYVAVDGQIRALEQAGKHQEAVDLCIGTQPGQSDWACAQFDQALGKVLQINQSEFAKAVDASFADLANLELLAGGAALLVAVLVVAGLYPRLSEYW